MNIPSKGRIVHYRDQGNEDPQAAIITFVSKDETKVNLAVFSEMGTLHPEAEVPLITTDSADWVGRGWSWPERIVVREVLPDEADFNPHAIVPAVEISPDPVTERNYPDGLAGDRPSGQEPEAEVEDESTTTRKVKARGRTK